MLKPKKVYPPQLRYTRLPNIMGYLNWTLTAYKLRSMITAIWIHLSLWKEISFSLTIRLINSRLLKSWMRSVTFKVSPQIACDTQFKSSLKRRLRSLITRFTNPKAKMNILKLIYSKTPKLKDFRMTLKGKTSRNIKEEKRSKVRGKRKICLRSCRSIKIQVRIT